MYMLQSIFQLVVRSLYSLGKQVISFLCPNQTEDYSMKTKVSQTPPTVISDEYCYMPQNPPEPSSCA